jgi:hypothetical protein
MPWTALAARALMKTRACNSVIAELQNAGLVRVGGDGVGCTYTFRLLREGWLRVDRLSSATPKPMAPTTLGSYEYDVALSFAGEDRRHAEELAKILQTSGVSVFYDTFEEARLWGMDLGAHLHQVYSEDARYVVIFASAAYAGKAWTNHERIAAQSRAIREKGSDYILPVRIDDTRIPGLADTCGYVMIERGIPYIFCPAHGGVPQVQPPGIDSLRSLAVVLASRVLAAHLVSRRDT